MRPSTKQSKLINDEPAKKTFILPISQMDAVMISLDDKPPSSEIMNVDPFELTRSLFSIVKSALRTLESFRSNIHYPSKYTF